MIDVAPDEEPSQLTVQRTGIRVMLKAPDGFGRGRHVSLDELAEFVDRARREARTICREDHDKYRKWASSKNVALRDSMLYVDTPWGEVQ